MDRGGAAGHRRGARLYWIVIDSISLYLYVDRGLYLTALLFAGYLVICVFGWLHWRRLYAAQEPVPASV